MYSFIDGGDNFKTGIDQNFFYFAKTLEKLSFFRFLEKTFILSGLSKNNE